MSGETPPLAFVYGEPMHEPPAALYIPPLSLKVMLSHFSGPMDLLLYLVRKHRFNILDIPMVDLCRQYQIYLEETLKQDNNLEIASDYLAMAALLVDIKSQMMLPKPSLETDEEDPRADLVRRLLEYELLRDAARQISEMPRRERDFVSPSLNIDIPSAQKIKPKIHPPQLSAAFAAALSRAKSLTPYRVWQKHINLREIMSNILKYLMSIKETTFTKLVGDQPLGASFVAVLQLANENIVTLRQPTADDELLIKLHKSHESTDN